LSPHGIGRIDTLIIRGVLKTDLAQTADIVLPGAAWVEKDATCNMTGHVQAAARVIQPPGDAGETGGFS
jgi:predicted molibdopterin-dependent oxidoreductase YjgC